MSKSLSNLPAPAFDDPKHHLRIYQGDCLDLLAQIPESSVDLVFADPPYFLSNGGITCHAGRMVSVHKGEWDKSRGPDANHEFNRAWLAAAQRVLKPNGSIWVSGTSHVIHSVGFAMQQLGFKLLNDISWVKPNPPPNLSCRYFTHATETIIWAAKGSKSRHTFNYKLMKEANRGKQMKSVQKPLTLHDTTSRRTLSKRVPLIQRLIICMTPSGKLWSSRLWYDSALESSTRDRPSCPNDCVCMLRSQWRHTAVSPSCAGRAANGNSFCGLRRSGHPITSGTWSPLQVRHACFLH
jgi:site-specific DNA-methyltransferase (adenine-specific)